MRIDLQKVTECEECQTERERDLAVAAVLVVVCGNMRLVGKS